MNAKGLGGGAKGHQDESLREELGAVRQAEHLPRRGAQPGDERRGGGQEQPVGGLRPRARAQGGSQRVSRKPGGASGDRACDALGARLRAFGQERGVDDDAGDGCPLAGRGYLVGELDGDSCDEFFLFLFFF